jgi:hypothetical protein
MFGDSSSIRGLHPGPTCGGTATEELGGDAGGAYKRDAIDRALGDLARWGQDARIAVNCKRRVQGHHPVRARPKVENLMEHGGHKVFPDRRPRSHVPHG